MSTGSVGPSILGLYGTAGHLGVSRPAQAEITLPILLYKAELDRRHLGDGPIWRAWHGTQQSCDRRVLRGGRQSVALAIRIGEPRAID